MMQYTEGVASKKGKRFFAAPFKCNIGAEKLHHVTKKISVVVEAQRCATVVLHTFGLHAVSFLRCTWKGVKVVLSHSLVAFFSFSQVHLFFYIFDVQSALIYNLLYNCGWADEMHMSRCTM